MQHTQISHQISANLAFTLHQVCNTIIPALNKSHLYFIQLNLWPTFYN